MKTIKVRQTRHAGHCWRSRDEFISDTLLWTPSYGRARAGQPARTYIQQLWEDTGSSPEDLPEALNDWEERRERVRDIRAYVSTWWWWCFQSNMNNFKQIYFDLYIRPEQVLRLLARVDLVVMAMKWYPTLTRALKLERHHQMQFCVISRILWRKYSMHTLSPTDMLEKVPICYSFRVKFTSYSVALRRRDEETKTRWKYDDHMKFFFFLYQEKKVRYVVSVVK